MDLFCSVANLFGIAKLHRDGIYVQNLTIYGAPGLILDLIPITIRIFASNLYVANLNDSLFCVDI